MYRYPGGARLEVPAVEVYLIGGALAFTMKDIRSLEQKPLRAITPMSIGRTIPTGDGFLPIFRLSRNIVKYFWLCFRFFNSRFFSLSLAGSQEQGG
jgi:hypothetical protein